MDELAIRLCGHRPRSFAVAVTYVFAGTFRFESTGGRRMASVMMEAPALGEVVYNILREAQATPAHDLRSKVRYPFFRPVSILIGDKDISAFSREVSEVGVGLLHAMALDASEVEVVIPTEQGYSVRIRTRIHWCHPCGEGWFLSGGEFLAIAGIAT